MRTLTIAFATWREAIRQPVSIIVLIIAALVTFLSQFLTFYHLETETAHDAIRQMSVASTLMCGIFIAVFTASAVLAEEIENRTVLTLLAKPVQRYEIILGKFLGIMMAIFAAFLVMMLISFSTVWWAEAQVEKLRTNPVLAVKKLPWLATGQGSLAVADGYRDAVTTRHGMGFDHLQSAGDFLLLLTGQSSQLVARVPLIARGPNRKQLSPGAASVAADLLRSVPTARTAVLLEAFVLTFTHVMVIAAFAVAVSTRLPLVFNALFCAAVFVLGNVWPHFSQAQFGEKIHILPNFENFDLTQALSTGIDRVGFDVCAKGVLYGIIYTALVLVVAVLLFRRREVA